jgi:hypothetical protein
MSLFSAAASPGSGGGSSSVIGSSASASSSLNVPQRKSRLRRQPKKPNLPTHLPRNQVLIWGTAICCLASLSILPIVLLESSLLSPESIRHEASHVKQVTGASVHHLMDMARQIRQHPLEFLLRKNKTNNAQTNPVPVSSSSSSSSLQQEHQNHPVNGQQQPQQQQQRPQQRSKKPRRQPEPPALTLDDLKAAVTTGMHGGDDADWYQQHRDHVARGGVAGRMVDRPTPPAVMMGAQRAHVSEDCPINVDSLAYWNDPVGTRDQAFRTPFAAKKRSSSKRKYITFAPDRGGWNNVCVLHIEYMPSSVVVAAAVVVVAAAVVVVGVSIFIALGNYSGVHGVV